MRASEEEYKNINIYTILLYFTILHIIIICIEESTRHLHRDLHIVATLEIDLYTIGLERLIDLSLGDLYS